VAADEQWRAARFAEHARRYSGFGWALIRLNGKVPRSQQWQTVTPDASELAAGKWAEWGKRYDMGVPLGPSRLAVLEDDTPEGRAQLLDLLGGELPQVPTVKSGGRSTHLYFLDEGYEPASRGGLELRCGRQQCAVPPSVHPRTGREYVWLVPPEAAELVPVPGPVLDFFAGSKGRLFADPVEQEIHEPGRYKALLSIAGTLRRRGLGGDEIAVSLAAINERRCKPPLPDDEVLKLAHDVAGRYDPEPPDLQQERIEQQAERELQEEPIAQPVRARAAKRQAHTRPIATIIARQTEWLIGEIIPLGTLSLVAGIGGLGKSGLLLAWAAPVTRAGHHVLIVSYEDAAEQVLRPRFEALDGDLNRLHELYVDPVDGSVSFPTDLPELERHARRLGARMVVIDPVSAAIDLRLDAHRDQDVRVVLGQLAKLAERERLAIVQNAHLNKAPSTDPYLRINGSTAFYNAARSVLTVSEDPLDRDMQRLVAHHKSNYGPLAPIQRWRVEPVSVESDFGPIETMRMVYVEDADDVDRQDVLGGVPAADKRTDAATLIVAELAFGRRLSSDVKEAGIKRGISPATIKRSAQDLEVVIEEETTAAGRVTYWSLPGSARVLVQQFEPTPPDPLNHAESGGSAQISETGQEPTPSEQSKTAASERQEGEQT
jgi:archaellum biogenesis ATPase FlaH